MLSKEQLLERKGYICGSDAPIVCGVSPWANKVRLWQEKIGAVEPKDISDSPYIKAGNLLEPVVRAWFEAETGLKVDIDERLLVSKSNPFMAAHLDGRVGDDAIFEAKTTSHDAGWGQQGENVIPDHYLVQVAHYMSVADVSRAYVAVLIRGVDFRHYVIERNLALEEKIISIEKDFWELVKSEVPPDLSTGEEVLTLFGPKSIESDVVATAEINDLIDELASVKVDEVQLQERKQAIEDKIKVYMGQNENLLNLSGKISITWKCSNPSRRFDLKELMEKRPEIYEEFLKEGSASRRFLMK